MYKAPTLGVSVDILNKISFLNNGTRIEKNLILRNRRYVDNLTQVNYISYSLPNTKQQQQLLLVTQKSNLT